MTDIINWINDLAADLVQADDMLFGTLSGGIPPLYQFALAAHRAVLPVGYTILALFFLLELLRCSTRAESFGTTLSVQMIAGILVKLGLSKAVMDYAPDLMSAVWDGMCYVTTQIAHTAGELAGGAGIPRLELDWWNSLMININAIGNIGYLVLGLIVLLLLAVVWVRVRLMIFMRFVEAYLYLIVAPIPLATLPGGEWAQLGKNFLKNFAAVAIQGTLLYALTAFYPVVISAAVNFVNAAQPGQTFMFIILVHGFAAALLLSALSGVTQLSRSIFSAM